jgi:hypothetical protein
LPTHRRELRPIIALIDNLMRDNKVVLSIYRCLQIVADNSSAATTAVHRSGIRIGQRHLMIGRGLNLCGHVLQEPHLAAQARDLLLD